MNEKKTMLELGPSGFGLLVDWKLMEVFAFVTRGPVTCVVAEAPA